MISSSSRDHIVTALQCLVFFLFVYSGISKTMGFDLFVNNMNKSLFLSGFNTNILGVLVIFIEFAIPVLIFFELTAALGYIISFLLLLMFTAYIVLMFMYSPYMPCSCGGLIEYLSWKQHIIFNLAFMGISLFLLFDRKKKEGAK